MANRLILVRGIPGSGKSTFAQRAFPGTLLLENDMFHIHQGRYEWDGKKMPEAISWCMHTAEAALKHGMDVVVCNTFTKRRFVEVYQSIAQECGAGFIVYRCTGHFQNQHRLSASMVANFERAMEDWPGEIVASSEHGCEAADSLS